MNSGPLRSENSEEKVRFATHSSKGHLLVLRSPAPFVIEYVTETSLYESGHDPFTRR